MSFISGRRRGYEELRAGLAARAEGADGETGDVAILLRFPDGTSLKVRFWKGAPLAAAAAVGLDSPWAKGCQPTGVTFYRGFPPTCMPMDTIITDDLQRAVLTLREGGPPTAEPAEPAEPQPPAASSQAQPQEGGAVELESAEEPAGPEPQAGAAAGGAAGDVRREQERSVREEREQSIQSVISATAVARSSAVTALQECNWSAESAVNRILDAQVQTRALLRAPTTQRQASPQTFPLLSGALQGQVGLQDRARAALGGDLCGGESKDWAKDCAIGAGAGCLLACLLGLKATFF